MPQTKLNKGTASVPAWYALPRVRGAWLTPMGNAAGTVDGDVITYLDAHGQTAVETATGLQDLFGQDITAAPTIGAGWTETGGGSLCRRYGKLVEIRLSITNNSTKNYSATDGGINNETVATIPAAYCPTSGYRRTGGAWGGRGCSLYLDTAGLVILSAIDGWGSATTVTSGTRLDADFLYLLD